MSMERQETITCPKCEHTQKFTLWASLNGDLDPKAKELLLEGRLFDFKCDNCGYHSAVDYQMLYHDMTNSVMIYYVNEESVEHAIEELNTAEEQIGIKMPDYRKRVVCDQNSLREKAIIFDQKLDDRIIEIVKFIYCVNAVKKVPNANIQRAYFRVEDDKFILQFIGDQMLSAEVPKDMYDDIKKEFSPRLADIGDKEAVIDLHWAAQFLQ